jgi:hypothetical protein
MFSPTPRLGKKILDNLSGILHSVDSIAQVVETPKKTFSVMTSFN